MYTQIFQYIFFAAILTFLVLWADTFIHGLPARNRLRKATQSWKWVMFALIALLVIALALDGQLFVVPKITKYF